MNRKKYSLPTSVSSLRRLAHVGMPAQEQGAKSKVAGAMNMLLEGIDSITGSDSVHKSDFTH